MVQSLDNQEKPRVLIRGASIAGLTAAARLNKAGYQCFVTGDIYQNTKIGGHEFDHGTLLTLPATFRDFFQKTGKHFGQVLEVNPCQPAFTFQFEELTLNFANLSQSARINEIKEKLGEAAALEWKNLISHGERYWDLLRENYIEWEFSIRNAKIPVYLSLKPPYVSNPYLQRILAHYATYFGYPAAIYKWSSLVAFAEESFGIWQVKGGLGALHQSIFDRAKELGVASENTQDFQYLIECNEIFNRPVQRLIGISGYSPELPVRTVIFHPTGHTTDIYATKLEPGKYSLVLTGKLDIHDFDEFIEVDQIRPKIQGNADNKLITKIRSANKKVFKVRHLDSLAHATIAGELLANALRGIKNRPSHDH